MLFSLKKHIAYNKCFDLFLASAFYFFDILNPVPLKGGVCGLYAYRKRAWNFCKLRNTTNEINNHNQHAGEQL